MLKHVQGYEISKSLENCKSYVKSFSDTKTRDMQDYVKPNLRENPDQIIVYVVAKDLASAHLNVLRKLQSRSLAWVIIVLKELCKEKKLYYINHEKKIITVKHLNGSKLHLNRKGTNILSPNTFLESISNALQ